MNRLFLSLAFFSFFHCFFAPAVSAEIVEHSWNISAMGGGYLFEGNQNIDEGTWTVGGLLGYNWNRRWGVEAAYNYVTADYDPGTLGDVDLSIVRLNFLYHFRTAKRFVPYIAFGGGGVQYDRTPGGDDWDGLFDYGIGFKYFWTTNFALRLDIHHLIPYGDSYEAVGLPTTNESHHNNLLAQIGLNWQWWGQPVVKDKDSDGVEDSIDKCPDTPKGVEVDESGCPLDSDGDKVADYLDKCPGTPKGVNVDFKGCPIDSDGDSVADYLDKCPDTPKGTKVDATGCPIDSDWDGVPDIIDRCPNTPRGVVVNTMGCPIDSDQDGVPDYLDKCPDTPIGVRVDENGCTLVVDRDGDGVPDDRDECNDTPKGAKVDARGCWVLQGLEFASGRSRITSLYYPVLNEALNVLNRNPQLRLEIQGHTDNVGRESRNQKLALKRAMAVKKYFTAAGISAFRLVAVGFGPARPIAANETPEGRAKNRRVELRPLK